MKLSTAVEMLDTLALHADDTAFDIQKKRWAILYAVNRFALKARPYRQTVTITTTASQATLDVTKKAELRDDFYPEQITSLRIGYKPLKHRNFEWLRNELDTSTSTARPDYIAWESPSSALMRPIPDAVYTITMTRTRPPTVIDPETSEDPELGLPQHILYDVIVWGARSVVLYGLGGEQESSTFWANYLAFEAEMASKLAMDTGEYVKLTDELEG